MAVDGMASIHSYAHLISQALRSIPSRRMVLSDIYDWFERHTDKAKVKTSTSKLAWKNSIRYNLSINKVRIYSMGEEWTLMFYRLSKRWTSSGRSQKLRRREASSPRTNTEFAIKGSSALSLRTPEPWKRVMPPSRTSELLRRIMWPSRTQEPSRRLRLPLWQPKKLSNTSFHLQLEDLWSWTFRQTIVMFITLRRASEGKITPLMHHTATCSQINFGLMSSTATTILSLEILSILL